MRQNPFIEKITASQLRDDIPDFRAGDTVRVHALIVEGKRERVQMFEGVVVKRHGSGISATYTVEKIDILRHGKVRRAKLYYLRERNGKSARIAEKRRDVEE